MRMIIQQYMFVHLCLVHNIASVLVKHNYLCKPPQSHEPPPLFLSSIWHFKERERQMFGPDQQGMPVIIALRDYCFIPLPLSLMSRSKAKIIQSAFSIYGFTDLPLDFWVFKRQFSFENFHTACIFKRL